MKTELRSVSHNNEKKWKRKEKKKGEGEVEVPHLMCVNVRFRAQETKRQLLYYFLFFFLRGSMTPTANARKKKTKCWPHAKDNKGRIIKNTRFSTCARMCVCVCAQKEKRRFRKLRVSLYLAVFPSPPPSLSFASTFFFPPYCYWLYQ